LEAHAFWGYFRIDKRRDREGFRRLLFAFDGILGTACFPVYRAHPLGKRQPCWAHLVRNLRGLEETGGKAKSLGRAGQEIVKAVFKEWYPARRHLEEVPGPSVQVAHTLLMGEGIDDLVVRRPPVVSEDPGEVEAEDLLDDIAAPAHALDVEREAGGCRVLDGRGHNVLAWSSVVRQPKQVFRARHAPAS